MTNGEIDKKWQPLEVEWQCQISGFDRCWRSRRKNQGFEEGTVAGGPVEERFGNGDGDGEGRLRLEVEDVCVDCLTLRQEEEKSQGNVKSSSLVQRQITNVEGAGFPSVQVATKRMGASGVLPLRWDSGLEDRYRFA